MKKKKLLLSILVDGVVSFVKKLELVSNRYLLDYEGSYVTSGITTSVNLC